MMEPRRNETRPGEQRRNLLLGIAQLARFHADGLAQFGDRAAGFNASLAPLVAFPLVQAGMMAIEGQWLQAAAVLLTTLVAVLATPVLSEALATRWGQGEAWVRYATAFNWCRWLPWIVFSVLSPGGAGPGAAAVLATLAAGAYGLALHWFIAWRGLSLSRGRAVLFVVLVGLGSGALTAAPHLAAMAFDYAQGSAG